MEYIFCIIAVIIQLPFLYVVLKRQNKNISALRMPYVYVSGAYLVIQFYVFFKYCIKLPDDYANLVQIGILVIFSLLEVSLFVGNRYIKRVDTKQQRGVAEFRDIIRSLEVKRLEFDDSKKQGYIDKLLEELKYSDPDSAECVRQENLRLKELIQKLDSKSSMEEIEMICVETSKVLSIRNIKTKAEKENMEMEVIKCPVCGNEKCKEITEDKYICLACDNVFLIHNLSKEFKQTDEHIDRVYTDLKDTIINNMASADGLDSAYRSAISLVERGDYRDAQEIFDDISKKYAWSYKGWYGQFLVAKKAVQAF